MKQVEQKNWLDQYKENYNGKSDEAKEIASYLKETYKGDKYVPWATMERLTYMQDPNAEFKTILNEFSHSIVHSDAFTNTNSVENKDGIVNKTSALVVSHFVKVSCTFLGKTFIEEYPIQEQDYTAAKIYNQNLVNKALKRALAKVASRATGLGLKLYENKDLQFETAEEETKPVVKKETAKKTEVKKEEPKVEPIPVVETKVEEVVVKQDAPVQVEQPQVAKVEENTSYSKEVVELCNLIKSTPTDKITPVLQTLNISILKKYGFVLSLEDSDDVLCNKLSSFPDVATFTRAINNMIK